MSENCTITGVEDFGKFFTIEDLNSLGNIEQVSVQCLNIILIFNGVRTNEHIGTYLYNFGMKK